MKPTNYDDQGCNPTSSNCVIWQGPDIECLHLCKGDTVSVVIAKLAEELCSILDTLDVSAYEFSCLNITDCEPASYKELFQLLIERICALENVDPSTPAGASGCPDCVVGISTCFYFQNEVGDTVRTMQLVDYVTAIGNRICDILQDIIEINTTLDDHEGRITALEGQQSTYSASFSEINSQLTVTPQYVLVPGQPTPINQVVEAVEAEFGELKTATGDANKIFQNIVKMMVGLGQLPQLAGTGNMASIPGWIENPTTLAEDQGNQWLAYNDMRAAILNLQAMAPSVCDDVEIYLSASIDTPDMLKLFFTGTLPSGYAECDPLGTLVTITDSAGGQLIARVPIINNLNNATGYVIDLSATPVNSNDDLTIKVLTCFTDPTLGTQCKDCVEYFLNNTLACPSLNIVPTDTTIAYEFQHVSATSATYTVELYDSSGTVLLQSETHNVSGATTVQDSFTGLTPNVAYKVKVKVQVGLTTTECPFNATSTLPSPCSPPGGVGAVITIN